LKGKINERVSSNKKVSETFTEVWTSLRNFINQNIINNENVKLIADPYNVFNRWKNVFNQVLNVHGFHEVRQMEI
jgi:hypothetical protein